MYSSVCHMQGRLYGHNALISKILTLTDRAQIYAYIQTNTAPCLTGCSPVFGVSQ